jgi:TetR/AcrR family transcriptional regulator of autoinduction and epiphytic fitness
MAEPVKRRYHAPRRAAAAALTREAILEAAKRQFESRGWSGATIRAIAADAQVSPKTVEALFATKATLLAAVVDYTFRGGDPDTPVVEAESALAVESAPDTATMLAAYAHHVVAIHSRAARIAAVVEAAAATDDQAAELWARTLRNRRFGAHWAAETLLAKADSPRLDLDEVEAVFLVGLELGTYRTLTVDLGFTESETRGWLQTYYRRMLCEQRDSG